jgi:hypothetical protein
MIVSMSQPVASHEIPVEDKSAFNDAVREGIEAADAGRLSPFEPVAQWLASWGTENELPTPELGYGSPIRRRLISTTSGATYQPTARPPHGPLGASFWTPV